MAAVTDVDPRLQNLGTDITNECARDLGVKVLAAYRDTTDRACPFAADMRAMFDEILYIVSTVASRSRCLRTFGFIGFYAGSRGGLFASSTHSRHLVTRDSVG
jgi:hypothetical protein